MLDEPPCKSDTRPGDEAQLASCSRTTNATTAIGYGRRRAPRRRLPDQPAARVCLVADETARWSASRSSIRTSRAPAHHGLFLKELYVAASARSKGVGEQLIDGIRALAKERGDTRVIWTTGEQNTGSQRFYDRLGMRREKKVYYVMDA